MVNSKEIAMLKTLLIIGFVMASLSLQVEAQPAKRMVAQLQRMSAPVASSPQKKATEKCLRTPQRFWYVVNVGSIERPLLKGFCRKAEPVSPFVDLG